MEIQSYRDLRVWQDAMDLAEACYVLTGKFPRDELFGLTSQIRRSSSSIAANIAEGNGRELTRSYIQPLRIAQGSLKELETHLLLSQRVGILEKPSLSEMLVRYEAVGKMLRSLIRALQAKAVR
ncbi:MAG TPA: four helix bundle protein [Hyphomonadaceae bacterium]|nr:four helix bundle protein [Hyphomonadaceae bacterium]